MNQDDSSFASKQGRETIDISQRSYTGFPIIRKPNFVVKLIASRNYFPKLPDMSGFTSLKELDLSRNKFEDLSPLSPLINLRRLNISSNKVRNLDFIQNLQNLEEIIASNNKIAEIQCSFPPNITYVDLSLNELTNLSFLDEKFPTNVESIDVSQNSIDQIIELKYISVFQNLRDFKVGLLDVHPDLNLLPYVKYLCPSLEFFDDAKIENSDSNLINDDELLNILMHGTEQQLHDFLSNKEPTVEWDEPKFIPFEEQQPPTPTSKAMNDNLLSPYQQDDTHIIHAVQQELVEIKSQIAKIAELLYVHDKALEQLWESQKQ